MASALPQPGLDDPVSKNMSFYNPIDAAAMKQGGDFSLDMPINEFFSKFGVDVNGPVSQLVEFSKKQLQNGNPMGKMMNIAKEGNMNQGMNTGNPENPTIDTGSLNQESGPSLDEILKQVR